MPFVQATDVPAAPPGGLPQAGPLPDTFQRIPSSPNDFGALEGQALEQLGSTVGRAADTFADRAIDLQKVHNATTVEDANTQYMKASNDLLFGTPDKPGFYSTKGKEAQYQWPVVNKQLEALETGLMGGLQNNAQKLAFQHETRYQRRWMDRDIASHYQKEITKAQEASLEGSFAVATNVAGKNFHDDDRFKDALLAADALAAQKGLGDPAATEAFRQKYRDQVYVERVTGYAAQEDWTGARAFLDKSMSYISDARVRKTLNDMVNDKAIVADINSFYTSGGQFLGPAPKTGAGGGGAFTAPAGPPISGASPQEQQLMNEVRFRESSHNYTAIGPTILTGPYKGQTAKGGYGFLDSTWAEAARATGLGTEFATADKAPPTTQDANALWLYRNRGIAPWNASGPYPGAGGSVEQRQGGATRNLPISDKVNVQLERASAAVGDLKVEVFSGGQPSSGSNRVGSHRHDEGEAADIQLRDVKTGKLLDMRVPADQARMAKFIAEAVAAGATGIGAAEDYMGPHGIHVGGGNPAVWGRKGESANAPSWVVAAYEGGLTAQGTPRGAAAKAPSGPAASGAGPQELSGSPAELAAFYDAVRKGEATASQFDQWLTAYRAKQPGSPPGGTSQAAPTTRAAATSGASIPLDLAPVPNFTGAVLGTEGPAYAPNPAPRTTEGSGGGSGGAPPAASAGGESPSEIALGVGGALMPRPVPVIPSLTRPDPLSGPAYVPPVGAPATPPAIPAAPTPTRNVRAEMAAIAARYPNPTDQVMAFEAYQHRFNAENAILQQEHRARVELSDAALGEYVARIAREDYAGVLEDIKKGTDKRLLGTTSHTIYEMALAERRRAEEKWPKTLGPGFYDVLQRITNDKRVEDRITDSTQIYSLAGPSNWLTIQGANQLTEILTSKSKTSAGHADAMYFDQVFKAAHARLTFTGLESMGIRDDQGETLHSQFIHQALPVIDKLKKEGVPMSEITDLDKGPLKPILDKLVRSPTTIMQNFTTRTNQMRDQLPTGQVLPAPTLPPGNYKVDKNGNITPPPPVAPAVPFAPR